MYYITLTNASVCYLFGFLFEKGSLGPGCPLTYYVAKDGIDFNFLQDLPHAVTPAALVDS